MACGWQNPLLGASPALAGRIGALVEDCGCLGLTALLLGLQSALVGGVGLLILGGWWWNGLLLFAGLLALRLFSFLSAVAASMLK